LQCNIHRPPKIFFNAKTPAVILYTQSVSGLAINYFSLPLTRPRNAARLILRWQRAISGEHKRAMF
jgi:hypothetical protein